LFAPAAKAEEDDPVVSDPSSPPPFGGDVSDTGAPDTGDDDALDVAGVTVDGAEAATVFCAGTASVPMAARTPPKVPSEINMVRIQEMRFFLFMRELCAGSPKSLLAID
jgi:hypothetical protein